MSARSANCESSQGSREVSKAAPKTFGSIKKWRKVKKITKTEKKSRNIGLNHNSKSSQKSNSKWGDRMEIWTEFENRMVFKCETKEDAETWIMKLN